MGICRLYLTDQDSRRPLIEVAEWETRSTWHAIVRGSFGGQEGLFLYDRDAGDAEFWTLSDRRPDAHEVRRTVPASEMLPLMDVVVAGSLSPDYKQGNGLLFYRKAGGTGCVMTVNDSLEFTNFRDFKDWPDSWDSIVIGPGSQILFYDQTNGIMQKCHYRDEEYPYLTDIRTLDRIDPWLTQVVYIPATSARDDFTLLYGRTPNAPGSGHGQVREGFGGEFLRRWLFDSLSEDWDLLVPGVFQTLRSRERWGYFAYSSTGQVMKLYEVLSGGEIVSGGGEGKMVGRDWTHIVRGQWVRRPDCCDCLLFYKA